MNLAPQFGYSESKLYPKLIVSAWTSKTNSWSDRLSLWSWNRKVRYRSLPQVSHSHETLFFSAIQVYVRDNKEFFLGQTMRSPNLTYSLTRIARNIIKTANGCI
ncbi:hypothetical protein N0Y54_00820 [Nostoc punctiforme UO1]|uniref:hypothetical protein n=1 Tax=Nostoc punctiforme TaxID=272131 RepID=UPI00309C2AB1